MMSAWISCPVASRAGGGSSSGSSQTAPHSYGRSPRGSDLLAATHPACIVDISVKGAGLRVPDVVDLAPGTPLDLGLDGSWSRARVVWSRPGWHDDLVAGVEFTDADPAFLTALGRWLDNYAAWRDVGDRRNHASWRDVGDRRHLHI